MPAKLSFIVRVIRQSGGIPPSSALAAAENGTRCAYFDAISAAASGSPSAEKITRIVPASSVVRTAAMT